MDCAYRTPHSSPSSRLRARRLGRGFVEEDEEEGWGRCLVDVGVLSDGWVSSASGCCFYMT